MTLSKGLRRLQRLRPPLDHLHVGQAEHGDGMPHEFGLLPRRFDERIAPVEVRDRERQAREPGARADIRDREALEVRQHGERIEQVLVHDLGGILDGGQVHARVPVGELLDEREHRLDLGRLEREAECLHAGGEPRLDPAFH